jgi:hypothetical protein
MSFAIVSVILGAFSPLVAFLIWNLPPLSDGMRAAPWTHSVLLLSQVAVIALAGIAGNVRLVNLLRQMTSNRPAAHGVLIAWLLVNMLLGTQLTWMLRPFFGTPHLPVQFLRSDALEGNFFESVYYLALRLINS